MVNKNYNKNNHKIKNNNSSDSLLFGRWPQTKPMIFNRGIFELALVSEIHFGSVFDGLHNTAAHLIIVLSHSIEFLFS